MPVRVPRKGTRGTRFPRFLSGPLSGLAARQFRRRGMRTSGGVDTVLLETVGAKSGSVRNAIVGYVETEPGAWIVIASLAGSAHNPAWLHNLARRPDATIEFSDGHRVEVHAESLEGEELEAAWGIIREKAPEYVGYLTKTDRQIPVLRLTARS